MSRSTFRANDPVRFTKGAATWWLRNSQSSGSISTLPEVLGGSAATAGTNPATANSDFTMNAAGNTAMSWPLYSANNGTKQWWASFHLKVASATSTSSRLMVIDATSGSANKLRLFEFVTDLAVMAQVFDPTSATARGGELARATAWPADTWVHATYEIDLTKSTEAKQCVFRLDGILQTLTFKNSVGSPGSMPSSMPAPTGNAFLFAGTSTGTAGITATIGRNLIGGCSSMPDATEGCLTPEAVSKLSSFERPG